MSEESGYQLTADAAQMRERYSVRYFIGPWAPGLIAVAALQPGECVLDVACGTGVVTRLAASAVGSTGRVVGLDINAAMLAVARTLPHPSGTDITWVEGNAVAMDFPDASFDVMLCQQGRHVGAETATRFRASRVEPDAETLRRLLIDAASVNAVYRSACGS